MNKIFHTLFSIPTLLLVMLVLILIQEYQRVPVRKTKQTHIEFHLVVYFSYSAYIIKFTNNNWETTEGIKSCTKSGVEDLTFFDSEQEAMKLASTLNAYEKCVRYNDSIVNNCNGYKKQIY